MENFLKMNLLLFACKVFVIIFLVCFNAESSGKVLEEHSPVSARIFHGDHANIEDFPFFASLGHCGAAILSEQWVVTAAHCVVSELQRYKSLFVGGATLIDSQSVRYDDVIFYPGIGYASLIPVNDIALIYLEKPLKFSKKVNAVALPSDRQSEDRNHVFVGRGIDETGSISQNLKKMDVLRLSSQECLCYLPEQYRTIVEPHLAYLEKVTVCAKRPGDRPGICFGDSGSPLVQNNTLIGLASYIGNTCENSRLGFYVNVATYVPWIKQVTGLG